MAPSEIKPTEAEREALRYEAVFQLKNSSREYATSMAWLAEQRSTYVGGSEHVVSAKAEAKAHRGVILASSELLGWLEGPVANCPDDLILLSREIRDWLTQVTTDQRDYLRDLDNGVGGDYEAAARAALLVHALDRFGFEAVV